RRWGARVTGSVKATGLASLLAPPTADAGRAQAKARLRPILRHAASAGVHVHFDTEHYDVKDLTFRLLRELLDEDDLADLSAGAVVQAYLKDSHRDLADLIELSSTRPPPIPVPLV